MAGSRDMPPSLAPSFVYRVATPPLSLSHGNDKSLANLEAPNKATSAERATPEELGASHLPVGPHKVGSSRQVPHRNLMCANRRSAFPWSKRAHMSFATRAAQREGVLRSLGDATSWRASWEGWSSSAHDAEALAIEVPIAMQCPSLRVRGGDARRRFETMRCDGTDADTAAKGRVDAPRGRRNCAKAGGGQRERDGAPFGAPTLQMTTRPVEFQAKSHLF